MLKPGVVAEDSGKKSDEEDATVAGVRQIEATVYDTLESYITTLNGPSRWLTYNSNTGKVDVTGLWGFVRTCRLPSKDVCAYDQIDRSGLANQLFGTDELPSLHFDPMIADLIEKKHDTYAEAKHWDEELVSEWRGDLVETDALEHTVRERVELSDPLALLAGLPMPVADDAEDSDDVEYADVEVAPYWRLSTGLWQSETTFASEANLALALAATEGVQDVDFQPVWAAGYELAERSGDPEDQLVAWICDCCAADGSQGEQEPEDSGSDEAAEEETGEE